MPFAQQPELKLPDPGTKIWRYMDFTKLVSLLSKRALYFASIESLASYDPFEGLYTKPSMNVHSFDFEDKRLFDNYRPLALEVLDLSKSTRSFAYVNCWHMNEHESAAMWKVYLKSDEGVAVQSNVQRVIDSLSEYDRESWIGQVSYMDYEKDYMPRVGPLWSKRKSFEHERELRVMVPDREALMEWLRGGGEQVGSTISLPQLPSGIYVPVVLDSLVEKIFVSPKAESWFADLVRSVCSKYDVQKTVEISPLADRALY
jgi:hypothetical protein